MKIETPQILWHNGSDNDNGKNAPLYSLSLLSFPPSTKVHLLATAGNTSEIHLWKVGLFHNESNNKRILSQSHNNKIQHAISLMRHDLSVNVVRFSPDGLHLATAGDGGSIILFSVAEKEDWLTVEKESDLQVKLLSACHDGVCDLQWSSDSKSFVVGTIEHTVLVYELDSSGKNWNCVYRNARDHTAYVQGVAYDPHGVYVASMGSDRTVRIYQRKFKKKKKKPQAVLQQSTNQASHNKTTSATTRPSFTDKLELTRAKTLKYRQVVVPPSEAQSSNNKQYLFADESTVESFFRRLSWTRDGAFLVTPAALWQEGEEKPSFATNLFARHRFDTPYKVLPGLEKPSVAVRPNPVLFQLPKKEDKQQQQQQQQDVSVKENTNKTLPYRSVFCVLTLDTVLIYDTYHNVPIVIARGLHYAGLTDATWSDDGRRLLVSSTDGYVSILSFDEGELGDVYHPPEETTTTTTTTSIPHKEEANNLADLVIVPAARPKTTTVADVSSSVVIPPCEPGQAATLVAPPAKRAKKTRITPTLVRTEETNNKRVAEETEKVGDAVTKLKIDEENNEQQPKKKKRITPVLVSVAP